MKNINILILMMIDDFNYDDVDMPSWFCKPSKFTLLFNIYKISKLQKKKI